MLIYILSNMQLLLSCFLLFFTFDDFYHISYTLELVNFLIADFDIKFIFQRQDKLHQVNWVSIQVVFQTQGFCHDKILSLSLLDADSVDLMEFILTLEDEFNIEISDEEIDQLQSVGDVVKIIQGK